MQCIEFYEMNKVIRCKGTLKYITNNATLYYIDIKTKRGQP